MYEEFYRFRASPFVLYPDPSFYFASKGHSRAFAHLKYGVFQGEGFIVITGEIGAGKTTVVRALVQQVDQKRLVSAQLVSTQLESDDLLRSVAAAFGLPAQGLAKAQLLATIEAFLVTLVPQQKRALLIVDEAQNLSAGALEELRMLSNFQMGDRALLQSVLVGQPELRLTLRSPAMEQLRQRVTSAFHLGPLDRDETRRYIEHRLHHVGWQGDPAFDDDVFPLIHQASNGIPRRINTLCNRLLLSGFLNEKHQLTVGDVARVVEELQDEVGAMSIATPIAVPEHNDADSVSKSSGNVVRPFATAAIVARLDRLESTLTTAIGLIRGLGPAEKRGRVRVSGGSAGKLGS